MKEIDYNFEEKTIVTLLSDASYGMHKCMYKLPKNHPYVLFSLLIILITVIILALFGNSMHKALLLIFVAVPIAALGSMFFHLAEFPQKNIRNAMFYTDLVVETKRLRRKKKLLARYNCDRNRICPEDFQMRYRARSMGDTTEAMDRKYINEMLHKIDALIEEF